MNRIVPHKKNKNKNKKLKHYLTQNVNNAESEKLCSRVRRRDELEILGRQYIPVVDVQSFFKGSYIINTVLLQGPSCGTRCPPEFASLRVWKGNLFC